jgi:hypothetical protein
VWPIRSSTMIASSAPLELWEERHTCTDGFSCHTLFPTVCVYSSCHDSKAVRWRKARSSLRKARSYVKVSCFNGHVPSQTYVARYVTKYNTVLCLVEAQHLLQNFQNDWMVRRVPLETLQCTRRVCKGDIEEIGRWQSSAAYTQLKLLKRYGLRRRHVQLTLEQTIRRC